MTTTSVFTTLFFDIIGDDNSTYNQMVNRLYDIEAKYFEKTPQWVEQPPTEVVFQIKEVVLKDFDKLADETLDKELKDRLNCLLHECRSEVVNLGYEYALKSLGWLKDKAYEYFGEKKPCPQIDESLLKKLYDKALIAVDQESDGQGIVGYNKGFHHALLHNTIWECKGIIEKRIIHFVDEDITELVMYLINENK